MQIESGVKMKSGTARRHKAAGEGAASAPPPPVPQGSVIAPLIARRLSALLAEQGVDVVRLARQSGIDRAVLDAILSGGLEPTVDLLWKVANALGVRIGSLLAFGPAADFALVRADEIRQFTSRDGGFRSRVLSPFPASAPVEFYGITLAPETVQHFEAHPPRTAENLAIHSGSVEIVIGREPPRRLDAGDSIYFLADVPHSYRNLGDEPAHLYLVMTYWGLPAD